MRSAAATASSTLSATSPLGTAIPCLAKSCLPWYSRRSMGGLKTGDRGRARRGPYPNAIISRSAMALPSLKNINWVTTDCYGTLIDWEKGIVDAVKKEAAKDGFTFEERPFLDRFFEVQAEVMAGSYELYAEVLRRSIVKVAGEFGWEIEPSRAQFLPNSVAYWLPFREANAAMDRLGKKYEIGIISNIDDKLLGISRRHLRTELDLVVTPRCAPNSTSSSPPSRSAATSRTRPTSKSARGASAAKKAGCTSAATTPPTSRR